jgi:DNA-binding beta-propeller fold protein YncE
VSKHYLNRWQRLFTMAGVASSFMILTMAVRAAAPLHAGAPIPLPGTHGGFDFIRIDASANRLLLDQEKGNTAFDVFDLKTKTLVKRVPTGTTQDVALDPKHERYYVSGNDPGRMLIISRKNLNIIGQVPLPTPTNLIGYDPVNGMVYETSDTTPRIWVIDAESKKVTATITLAGTGMQELAFEPKYKRIYQALKGAATISLIDPATNTILHVWSLAPGTLPHGIAVVPGSKGLLVACNGVLMLMDRTNGKIIGQAEIAPDVDEIAYDPGNHHVYCASKDGEISVVRLLGNKLTTLGNVPDEKTTHSIAVDPNTHTVWIGYAKGSDSFVQPFTPTE